MTERMDSRSGTLAGCGPARKPLTFAFVDSVLPKRLQAETAAALDAKIM